MIKGSGITGLAKRNVAVVLVGGLVAAGGAVAWAADPPARPSNGGPVGFQMTVAPNSGQNPGRPHRRGPKGVLGRAVHGELIVREPGSGGDQASATFRSVTFDRGEVTTASGSSLTIKRPDGPSVTVALTADTKYKGGSGAGDLKAGQRALVVSRDGKALLVATGHHRKHAGPDGAPDRAPDSGTARPSTQMVPDQAGNTAGPDDVLDI